MRKNIKNNSSITNYFKKSYNFPASFLRNSKIKKYIQIFYSNSYSIFNPLKITFFGGFRHAQHHHGKKGELFSTMNSYVRTPDFLEYPIFWSFCFNYQNGQKTGKIWSSQKEFTTKISASLSNLWVPSWMP